MYVINQDLINCLEKDTELNNYLADLKNNVIALDPKALDIYIEKLRSLYSVKEPSITKLENCIKPTTYGAGFIIGMVLIGIIIIGIIIYYIFLITKKSNTSNTPRNTSAGALPPTGALPPAGGSTRRVNTGNKPSTDNKRRRANTGNKPSTDIKRRRASTRRSTPFISTVTADSQTFNIYQQIKKSNKHKF